MPSPRTSTTKGFTLVELLVSMGIFTFLASLGLFVSMDFYRSYAFRSESTALVSAVERARNRSMNNINATSHGIHIASTSYTIFQGPSYAARTVSYDEAFPLNSGIIASGTSDILFAQVSGESDSEGDIILQDGFHTATISLNYEGRISW